MCPRVTLSGLDWQSALIEYRESKGIPIGKFPMFPARGNDEWLKVSASLVDVNAVVTSVLIEQKVPEADFSSIHRFKLFLLACAAKYGMKREPRRILGYHKDPSSAVRAYEREVQTKPLMELASMIKVIKEGKFNPDMNMDEMWVEGLPVPLEDKEAASVSSGNESSTDESMHRATDDDSSGEEAGLGRERLAEVVSGNHKQRDDRIYQHVESDKVHLGLSGSLVKAFCNTLLNSCRRLTIGVEDEVDEHMALCQTCFGKDAKKAKAFMMRITRPDEELQDESQLDKEIYEELVEA